MLPYLRAFDAWITGANAAGALTVLRGPGRWYGARAAEAVGDRARARRLYDVFLRTYDLPPPEHRAWVDSARAALARLD